MEVPSYDYKYNLLTSHGNPELHKLQSESNS